MDPYSSPTTHSSSFNFFVSIPLFPASQRPVQGFAAAVWSRALSRTRICTREEWEEAPEEVVVDSPSRRTSIQTQKHLNPYCRIF